MGSLASVSSPRSIASSNGAVGLRRSSAPTGPNSPAGRCLPGLRISRSPGTTSAPAWQADLARQML